MSTNFLKVAVAQLNCVVGDLDGNLQLIADAAEQARARGADLLVTPELALCGYPPEDLLLRPDFFDACAAQLQRLAAGVSGIALMVGYPRREGGRHYNSVAVIRDGAVIAHYDKCLLPNSEVFDEERYFDSSFTPCVVEIAGFKVGINICEDVWESGPAEAAKAAGAEVLVTLNASPYHMHKQTRRYSVLRERIAATGIPMLYVNLVGGQDELVFDGGSFALDADGRLAYQAPSCRPVLDVLHLAGPRWNGGTIAERQPIEAEVYEVLTLGVRDYLDKNGFPGAIIGLSGGIDSALTLCVAVDAIGPERVRAVMMPSPYTAQMSLDDSRALVQTLGVRYDEISIAPAMETFAELLAPQFAGLPADTTEENLQSRIRGMILMALSNKTGALVLTTGNKSEMATGYATLYGDMAGGFAVLKDVYKTFVYRLANWLNRDAERMPHNIIVRPPSAELKPDQKDQDSLPPYEVLDAIIEAYMEQDLAPRDIIARGYSREEVQRVVGMLKRNEYKRRQAPVGVRVTPRGFGKDWRYPITSRYRDSY